MVILELIHNIALLLALTVAYDYIGSRLIYSSLRYRVIAGVLFGAVSIIGMMTPLQFAPGVIYDGRSIVLTAAGYIGGPLIAGIAGAIVAAFRIYLGGAGALPGVLVIIESSFLGAVVYCLRKKSKAWEGTLRILLLGLVVHFLMLMAQLVMPGRTGWEVLLELGPAVMIFYPLALVLILRVFLEHETRQLVQKDLVESEERYRSLFENVYNPILILDSQTGRIVDVNNTALKFYGRDKDTLCGMTFSDVSPSSFLADGSMLTRIVQSGKYFFQDMHESGNGSVRNVAVFSGVITIKGSERIYLIVQDTTNMMLLERDLYLRDYAIKNAAIGIFQIADPDGSIAYVNSLACEQLGYSREELSSLKIFDIDPSFTEERWTEQRNLVHAGRVRTYESMHRRKDGSEFPVEVSISSLTYEGKVYLFAFFRDITARKKAENELVDSLEQKEVLLREVHHRVKNNLAVINSLIFLEMNELPDDAGLQKALYKTRDRIQVMGMIHNMLYHDQNLSQLEFGPFLQQLTTQLHDSYADSDRVSLSLHLSDVYLDVTRAVPLGIIVNEALTNALLHAFPAPRRGTVAVRLESVSGNGYRMAVEDDGVGLPDDFFNGKKETLGMQLIHTLSRQIEAELSIRNEKGTAVEIVIPE
ncbi:MAG: PAS domain S-box protein [Spirochaetota bacterium]|nr:PAS domain S-box protein [Spirochaetota bacterium]